MKVARFVLKIVALSLAAAAAVCAIIAYWDSLLSFGAGVSEKFKKNSGIPSEYDDYVEE